MSDSEPRIAAWEDITLRLIAVYKLSKTVVFIAVGVGLLHVLHQMRHTTLEELLSVYVFQPMHFEPDSQFVHSAVEWASKVSNHAIREASIFAFVAAIFFAVEGIGLYLRAHWAEYLVLVSTGSLLPLEIWEVCHKLEWWKAGVLLANVAILLYLVHRLLLDSEVAARRRLHKEERQKRRADSVNAVAGPR
jgi:uncharacterized membrane protein (DUF2068 family)